MQIDCLTYKIGLKAARKNNERKYFRSIQMCYIT